MVLQKMSFVFLILGTCKENNKEKQKRNALHHQHNEYTFDDLIAKS